MHVGVPAANRDLNVETSLFISPGINPPSAELAPLRGFRLVKNLQKICQYLIEGIVVREKGRGVFAECVFVAQN